MMWLARIGGAFAVALAGCGASEPPVSHAPLDVDVVVAGSYVTVYVGELERPCTCMTDAFPLPDECVTTSDTYGCTCAPPPGSRLASLRAEREGAVVATADLDAVLGLGSGSVAFAIPGANLADTRLVLEGCGGLASVALPVDSSDDPSIDEVRHTRGAIMVDFSGSDAPDVLTSLYTSGGGPRCRTETPGTGEARGAHDDWYSLVLVQTLEGYVHGFPWTYQADSTAADYIITVADQAWLEGIEAGHWFENYAYCLTGAYLSAMKPDSHGRPMDWWFPGTRGLRPRPTSALMKTDPCLLGRMDPGCGQDLKGKKRVRPREADEPRGQSCGVRREGPSISMVWQRWRRRSRSAPTMSFWPRNSYHLS